MELQAVHVPSPTSQLAETGLDKHTRDIQPGFRSWNSGPGLRWHVCSTCQAFSLWGTPVMELLLEHADSVFSRFHPESDLFILIS